MEDTSQHDPLFTVSFSPNNLGCANETESSTVPQSQDPKKVIIPSVVSLLNESEKFRPQFPISASEEAQNHSIFAPPPQLEPEEGSSRTRCSVSEVTPNISQIFVSPTPVSDKNQRTDNDSHMEEESASPQRTSAEPDSGICQFFLQGNCKYGSQCALQHSAARSSFDGGTSPERSSVAPPGHQPHHHFYHSSRTALKRNSPSSKSVQGGIYTFSLDKVPSPSSRSPQSSGGGAITGGGSLLKPFACSICDRTFNRLHNLKSHLATHSVERPYQCDKCSQSFRRLHDLKRHQRMHTGIKPFVCKVCTRQFSRQDALNRHQKADGSIPCNVKQISRKIETNTMDTSESLVISVERQMSTSDLPNGVECQASCVKHDEIVPMESEPAENNELATSPECLATSNVNVETTSTKQTDIDHNLQKVLNDGPPYKCCTEIFSSLDQFTCHVETIHASTIHTRHRPSSAEPTRSSSEPLPSIPDQPMMMTFSVQPTTRASGSPSPKNASDTRTKKPAENPANMDRDQRQQAGLLPHFCSMCLMAFGRRQELKRHMWTHEKNSKVYTCEICNKSCSRRDALLRHQRTMHNRHELHVQSMDKSDRITKPASNRNKSPATNGADSFKLLQVQQFNQLLSQKGKKEGSAGMPFQVKEESPPQARAQAHAQEHDRPPIPPLSVISCRDAAPQLLKINCSTPTAFTGTQTDSYSSTSPSSRRGIDQLVKDFMSPHSMNFQHREGQMYLQPASEISSPNKHLAQPIPSNSLPTSATSPWDASPAADSTANLCKRIEDLMTQLERANSAIERHRRKNRDLLVENRVLKSLVTGGKTKRRRSSSPQSIHSPSDMMDTDEDV